MGPIRNRGTCGGSPSRRECGGVGNSPYRVKSIGPLRSLGADPSGPNFSPPGVPKLALVPGGTGIRVVCASLFLQSRSSCFFRYPHCRGFLDRIEQEKRPGVLRLPLSCGDLRASRTSPPPHQDRWESIDSPPSGFPVTSVCPIVPRGFFPPPSSSME